MHVDEIRQKARQQWHTAGWFACGNQLKERLSYVTKKVRRSSVHQSLFKGREGTKSVLGLAYFLQLFELAFVSLNRFLVLLYLILVIIDFILERTSQRVQL